MIRDTHSKMLATMRELRQKRQGGFTETDRAELGWGLDMTPEKRDEVLQIQRGIQTMEDRLLRHNVAAPPPEREVGTLQKILGFLRRGETAPAIMAGIRGESMGRAYWQSAFGAEPLQRISYSDVFSELGWRPDSTIGKWIKGAAGLAADILLDPTTYLTFGKGGAIKLKARIKGEVCELGLNRTGTDMLKRYVGEFGEKEGRVKMSQFLTDQKDLGKYVVPDGLKFMGQQIPIIGRRQVVTAPFKFADWMGRNTPLVNVVYKKADDLLREAFVPFSKIDKLPAMRPIIAGHKIDVEDGTAFKELYLRTIKGTRAEQLRETKHIWDLSRKAKKALPEEKELGKTLSEALEAGRPTGFKVLDDVLDFARRRHKEMFFLEQKYKITTHELPDYLKHVITKEGREFVNKGGDIVSHLSKPLRVRLTKPRHIEGAIKEINEEWMKKHGHKLFEEDFFKIFALRTAEHIQNVRLYEFFEEVSRRWGVLPETYWRQKIHPITGKVTREKIVRPITVPVQGGIRFVESAIPQLKGVLFPEPIVKHLDSYHRFLNEEEVSNFLLRQYDRLLRFWKVSVTGIWPAFHTRNIYGSVWNNWLRGLNDPMRYKQAHDVVTGKKGNITTELGTKYDYAQVNRFMDDLGLSTQPGMLDVYRTTEDLLEKGFLKKALDTPLGITEAVERRVRGALFIDRLIKGDTPEDAAKAVFATLFDYSPEGLTAFERNVMRRVMPFWRWTKGNVPYQTEMLIKQPGKFAVLPKFKNMFDDMADGGRQQTEQERSLMPEWMAEMFTLRLPGAASKYIQLDLPATDLNVLPIGASGWRKIGSMISPFLKYPIERWVGRDLYFGGDLWNPDLPAHLQTRETVFDLQSLPQPLQLFLGFREVTKSDPVTGEPKKTYEMDARKVHALRTFLGRFWSSYARVTDEDQTTFDKISHLITGTPIREVDITEGKQRQLYDRQRQLRALVGYYRKRGIIPKAREEEQDDIRNEMRKYFDIYFRR